MGLDPTVPGTVVEAIAREIRRQRSRGAGCEPCVLRFEIEGKAGCELRSVVVGDVVQCLEGGIALPGLPWVGLKMRDVTLVALVCGEANAGELLRRGDLEIEGSVDLVTALAACFPGARTWLSAPR